MDLFAQARHFLSYYSVDNISHDHRSRIGRELDILERSFDAVCITYRKLSELFDLLFSSSRIDWQTCRQELFQFIWLLFLYSKERLLDKEKLTSLHCFLLGVASLMFVYDHAPSDCKQAADFGLINRSFRQCSLF